MTVPATSLQALAHALDRAEHAAAGVSKATRPKAEAEDRVELSTEAVGLLAAKNSYDAAIELAKTSDEITKATINLLA